MCLSKTHYHHCLVLVQPRGRCPNMTCNMIYLFDFLRPSQQFFRLTSWLSFVVSNTVSLSLSHWYPGSGVVLDCIDS